MKAVSRIARRARWAALLVAALAAVGSLAFPPAPHHSVYGLVRDELGNPLEYFGAEVLLQVEGTTLARTPIATGLEPGVSYRLSIPVDSGAMADLYKPTALLPTVPFRMRVKIGGATYLPIEMSGGADLLTIPGESTRVDLTLGLDADGNGLPDAWEQAIADLLGRAWVPGGIQPGDLYPGAGMTFRDVYISGIYAADPEDGFALDILHEGGAQPRLAFTAIRGRSYTVQAAATLGEWRDVPIQLLPHDPDADPVRVYHAADTRRVEIQVPELPGASARFFRLIVQ